MRSSGVKLLSFIRKKALPLFFSKCVTFIELRRDKHTLACSFFSLWSKSTPTTAPASSLLPKSTEKAVQPLTLDTIHNTPTLTMKDILDYTADPEFKVFLSLLADVVLVYVHHSLPSGGANGYTWSEGEEIRADGKQEVGDVPPHHNPNHLVDDNISKSELLGKRSKQKVNLKWGGEFMDQFQMFGMTRTTGGHFYHWCREDGLLLRVLIQFLRDADARDNNDGRSFWISALCRSVLHNNVQLIKKYAQEEGWSSKVKAFGHDIR